MKIRRRGAHVEEERGERAARRTRNVEFTFVQVPKSGVRKAERRAISLEGQDQERIYYLLFFRGERRHFEEEQRRVRGEVRGE